MTRPTRTCPLFLLALSAIAGCAAKPVPYGREALIFSPRHAPRAFAVAPALNLSGQRQPDPLLQADLIYQELQQVRGVTVVPVNRVVQAFVGLGIRQVESPEQAWAVCDAIGVDALIVPTITAWDPYDPPKIGASLQTFVRTSRAADGIDVRQLGRSATEQPAGQPGGGRVQPMARNADFIQAARMFDAAAGSTRARVSDYARGRVDPTAALGEREFYLNMDRYGAFVWHELIDETLRRFK